jgi:hypothetical protein
MQTTGKSITIEPVALERCFLVADILAEDYESPFIEYGLMALSTSKNPFHIVHTPLLPNQRVTAARVFQAGLDVLVLRREVEILSKRRGEQLIPVGFVHRHMYGCMMSGIDSEFLTTVLIDQISTVVASRQSRLLESEELDCDCLMADSIETNSLRMGVKHRLMIECGFCFSIIVTRSRDIAVFGAEKLWCPQCEKPSVRIIDTSLSVSPERELTNDQRNSLRKQLEIEIESKINFESTV